MEVSSSSVSIVLKDTRRMAISTTTSPFNSAVWPVQNPGELGRISYFHRYN